MEAEASFTQAGRMMAVSTVLGTDAFLLERLEVHEGLSQLFTIRATVRAQREEIKPDELVGTGADLTLTKADGSARSWNGLITELHEGPVVTRGNRHYALTLRPRLWLMSQRSDCRIFLEQTTQQVIETLCKEHGIEDLDLAGVTGKPEKQLYAVQWNETDLAYMLRRIQEDGLFYYFRHEKGRHVFAVGDHTFAYREGEPEAVRIAFGSADEDHIHDWRRQLSFTPGRRAGGDWEFTTPNTRLQSVTPSLVKVPGNVDYELYEYPGRFLTPEAGETATKLRIQSSETDFDRVEGRSSVRTLAAGFTFTPHDVAHPEHTYAKHVTSAILHRAEDPTYETGAGAPHYENEFEAMPAERPATPHRSIARPRIDGIQIARIAGPQGEEIHTDQFGRIKLTFPWDRRARGDGTDTGWVRVSQPWAGTTWGQQTIPRVGMEALVAYQEGDPDRPIVVGLVPNPNTPVPYDLPANKTRMVMRSNSYKSKGANEIALEDMTAQENMFLHAQKDMTQRVLNNQTQRVDASAVSSIGQHQGLEVAGNQNAETGGSQNNIVGAVGPAVGMATAALSPMLAQTAQLAGSAASMAGGLGGGSGASAAAGMAGAAGGLGGMIGSVLGGGGGGLMQMLMPMISQGASALMSMLGQQGRGGVVGGSNPLGDGGTALAGAGAQMAQQGLGSLFGGMPGIQNNLVTSARNTAIGAMDTETVGQVKALNVGQAYFVQVGKIARLTVGSRYEVSVQDVISSRTTKHVMVAGDKLVLAAPGGEIEINNEGVFIKGKRVEIRGQSILLAKGDGGCNSNTAAMEE